MSVVPEQPPSRRAAPNLDPTPKDPSSADATPTPRDPSLRAPLPAVDLGDAEIEPEAHETVPSQAATAPFAHVDVYHEMFTPNAPRP